MQMIAKYEQVVYYYVNLIRSETLYEKDRIESENKIANKFQISRITVRKALKELQDMGLIIRKKGSGTYIAKGAKDIIIEKDLLGKISGYEKDESKENGNTKRDIERHRIIGVILPEIKSFFPGIFKAIETKAEEMGYMVNLGISQTIKQEAEVLDRFEKIGVDGIILNPIRYEKNYSFENYLRVRDMGIPFYMIGKPPEKIICDSVYCDDIYGEYEAVNAIIKKGCKKIFHITNSNCDTESVEERTKGYVLSLRENGYIDKDINKGIIDTSNHDWKSKLEKAISQTKEKIGISLYDDLMAPIILDIVSKSKKEIPNEVAILGYNNLDICENLPIKMTSVKLPQKLMGETAILELINMIEKTGCSREVVRHTILKPSIEFRETL